MRTATIYLALAVMLLGGAVFLPRARANEWDQAIRLSFSQPVEIPGHVLPAGSYWFILADNFADRNFVQVYSPNWQHLYATLPTVTRRRLDPASGVEVRFAERPHKQPEAMLTWFYPGAMYGHTFLYPEHERKQWAGAAKADFLLPSRVSLSRPAVIAGE
jgi:hypothetical protein